MGNQQEKEEQMNAIYEEQLKKFTSNPKEYGKHLIQCIIIILFFSL